MLGPRALEVQKVFFRMGHLQDVVERRDPRPARTGPDRSNGPILRWAGGKRWLLPRLREIIGTQRFHTFHEPFVGGGSVFLGLRCYSEASIGDSNVRLIETYSTVREQPEAVAIALQGLPNSEEYYYKTRSEIYEDPVKRAAQFIFLNHTSFNGIYRVNARGEYNVPYGRRKHLNIPDLSHLCTFARRLHGVKATAADFEVSLGAVASGDLVFVDPPYVAQKKTDAFARYNSTIFTFDDQRRLAKTLEEVARAGAKFIVTNTTDPSVAKLFDGLGKAYFLTRSSRVGGSRGSRGNAEEMLVTNIELQDSRVAAFTDSMGVR